ncbi:hypothetical protein FSO04_30805 [Paraburkholderia madseniana]|uniref:Uncharacterized protein n=1 Tax=Paraburkholderia madseniana TaxID=2599607 RepID=A0A6N6W6N6_9BURK|nr:hypothetical protein [Paraburkholderia madseniana]KAE8756096.1 hypothetical protein FSO04_30805 [Paraburkholderia madseniana]
MTSSPTEFLTMLTALTGVYAAGLWGRASKVSIIAPASVHNGGIEPGDPLQAINDWLTGIQQAGNTAAVLNQRAARWTAVSVSLAAITTVVGNVL